jgi:photosystem II stability/assembly factor-like uncharacterized protein
MRAAAIVKASLALTLVAGTCWAAAPERTHADYNPKAPHAIFAGLDSQIFQSTDGGDTWTESDSGLAEGAVYPLTAGAGVTIYSAPGNKGVYVSNNGGATWQDDNGVGGPEYAAIYGLAVDPGDGRRIYAVDGGFRFYRSFDGGAHWTVSDAPLSDFSGSSANALQVDPLRPASMLLASHDGMDISRDNGYTWDPVSGIPDGTDVFAATYSGASPDVAYAATSDGIYQSLDGGRGWTQLQHGAPDGVSVTVVAIDPLHPTIVVAYSEDGTIFRTTNGGASWTNVGDTGGETPRSITFDPINPGTVIAGGDAGDLFTSGDDGATWQEQATPFGSSAAVLSLAAALRAPLPTDAVPAPPSGLSGLYYASATHHIIGGSFLQYYNKYGGLRIFGLPLTEAFVEHGQRVQYFERIELVLSGGKVHTAALGSQLSTGRHFSPAVPTANAATRLYFPTTHHRLADKFLKFWQTHYGSTVFGLPISEPLKEQNGDGTGRTYLVQYFQNGRLEYHPELTGTGFEISVGLIGRQALQQRGWI